MSQYSRTNIDGIQHRRASSENQQQPKGISGRTARPRSHGQIAVKTQKKESQASLPFPGNAVLKIGLLGMVLDIRFWLLTVLPFLLLIVSDLADRSLWVGVVSIFSLSPIRLYALVVVGLVVGLMVVIGSIWLSSLLQLVGQGRYLTALTNVSATTRKLLQRAASQSLSVLVGWLIQSLMIFGFMAVALTLATLLLSRSIFAAEYIVAVIILACIIALSVLVVRHSMRRIVLSGYDLRITQSENAAWQLFFASPWKAISAGLVWSLVLVIVTSAGLAIAYGLYVALQTFNTLPVRLMGWLAWVVLIGSGWQLLYAWRMYYWTKYYTQSTQLLSSKLTFLPPELYLAPNRLKPWRVLIVALLVLVLAMVLFVIAISYQPYLVDQLQRLGQALPGFMNAIVPAK